MRNFNSKVSLSPGELHEWLHDHEQRLREVEKTGHRIMGVLAFLAVEIPVAVAVAALFLHR